MKSLAGSVSVLSFLVLMTCLQMACAPSLTRAQALQRIKAELKWVPMAGGEFEMGCDEGEKDCPLSQRPRHAVRLADFEMSETEVSLGAYRACVAAGACTKAVGDAPACLWDKPGGDGLPVNCVTYEQAVDFAEFVGARLPSEAEWEYAARSRGKDQPYPWGQQAPTCRHAAVDDRSERIPCPKPDLLPGGSRPLGNSIEGVSDLVGNVSEWVADCYDGDYEHAHKDGSPVMHPHRMKETKWCYEPGDFIFSRRRVPCRPQPEEKPEPCKMGVIRGSFYLSSDADESRVRQRGIRYRDDADPFVGIRLARDAKAAISAEAAEAKAAAYTEQKVQPAKAVVDPNAPRPVLEWVRIPGKGGVAAFEISRHEVTVAQYRACVAAGACTEPQDRGKRSTWKGEEDDKLKYPVNNISFKQARAFAEWLADCRNKDGSPCEDKWGAVAGGGWISDTEDMQELEVKQRVREGRWRDVGIRLVR